MVERVLDYNRDIVAQETGYWRPKVRPSISANGLASQRHSDRRSRFSG